MTESEILWHNAQSLGIDLIEFFDYIGFEVACKLEASFGKDKTFGIICGLGGNAGDGLATAYHLANKGINVNVYLIGRNQYFEHPTTKAIWDELVNYAKDQTVIKIKKDCYADDIGDEDVFIEALVGTGLEGDKLNKRYHDVIKSISHKNKPLVAVDIPAPHYKPDLVYSINYPKTTGAEVIKITLPPELENFCGPGEKMALWEPNTKTHINKNGSVLVLSDTNKIKELFDKAVENYPSQLAFFYFQNNLQSSLAKKIDATDLEKLINASHTIVMDQIEETIISYATVNHIIKTYKEPTYVLTQNSLYLIETENFKENKKILIFKGSELKKLSDKSALNENNLKRFAKEYGAQIAVIGATCYLYNSNGELKIVRASKSPDILYEEVLANSAMYSAKNDAWLSIRAALA